LTRGLLAIVVTVIVTAGCSSDGESSTTSTPVSSASTTPTEPSVETSGNGPPTATDFDRSLPSGDEPEVLGPLGSTNVEFDTDDGRVQIGAADLPAGVAPSFPVPDDLVIQIASENGGESGFSGVSQRSFGALVELYEDGLPAAGYETERSRFVEGVVAVIDFAGPDGSGQVAISSAPAGGSGVLVTFGS
jgi:hypothetical protein